MKKNVIISISDEDGKIIKEFKRPHVAPAEMEKIALTKKQFEAVSTNKVFIQWKRENNNERYGLYCLSSWV